MFEIILLIAWIVSAVISCAAGAEVCGLIGFAVGTWIGYQQSRNETHVLEQIQEIQAEIDERAMQTIQEAVAIARERHGVDA